MKLNLKMIYFIVLASVVKIVLFCILAHTSKECISQIWVTYAVIFLTMIP